MAVQGTTIINGTTTSIPVTLIDDRLGTEVNFSGGTLSATLTPTSGSAFTIVGEHLSGGVGIVNLSAGDLSGVDLLDVGVPFRLHGRARFTTVEDVVYVRSFNVGVLPDDGEWVFGLTTLAAAREFLGYTDHSEDYDIASVIRSESQRIRRLAGRNESNGFKSMERTEDYDWPLSGEQYPREWPVTAIDSIVERYSPTGSHTVSTGLYEITADARAIRFWDSHRGRFLSGLPLRDFPMERPIERSRTRETQLVYTGGYTTVPANLEDIALAACAQKWVNKGRDLGMQSESLGSYSYTRKAESEVDKWLTDQLREGGWLNPGSVL